MVPDPFLLSVVFQTGGGDQAAPHTLQPSASACFAVAISGTVGIGLVSVSGSDPSLRRSLGCPTWMRRSESPRPFLASNSWSAMSSLILPPKKTADAPNPSIDCFWSDQVTVTSCGAGFVGVGDELLEHAAKLARATVESHDPQSIFVFICTCSGAAR